MDSLWSIGASTKTVILQFANLVITDEMPGWVSIGLVFALALLLIWLIKATGSKISAVNRLNQLIRRSQQDDADFASKFSEINQEIGKWKRKGRLGKVATAWAEYRETLIDSEEDGTRVFRNSVRPSVFFNQEDLHYGAGFFRIVPNLFVTVGLSLTFLGLIAALQALGQDKTLDQAAMANLVSVASAKFIMSLTGLVCSIVFTIGLRISTSRIERALNSLNGAIETRLSFVSLEELAIEQLRTTREQKEHFRTIGMELVAEIGRPLREELPNAISSSISTAIEPVLKQVSQMSSDGVGEMVSDLSNRFTDDVGRALATASERLAEAGDRIGQLVDRMDQTSNKMGSEMDGAVQQLALSLKRLQESLSAGAEQTRGAFVDGTDQLLSAMNQTLSNIQENTGKGAEAISAAAADLRAAAEGIRTELEAAAQQGADAARDQMQATSEEVGDAISKTGQEIIRTFGNTSEQIAKATDDLREKAVDSLLQPMDEIAERLTEVLKTTDTSLTAIRQVLDGLNSGAQAASNAAGRFESASKTLTEAATPIRSVVERMEKGQNELTATTRQIGETVTENARTVTETAASALESAEEILSSERAAIEATLSGLTNALDAMRGQGDRLDDLDEKLGGAFEAYRDQVDGAVRHLQTHVKDLQEQLTPALDTMRTIVEQAESFAPESRRN